MVIKNRSKIKSEKEKHKTEAEQTRSSKTIGDDQVLLRSVHPLLIGHNRCVLFVVIGKTKKIRRQLGD